MNLEYFYKAEAERVANNFNKSKHKGFENKHEFAGWFVNQLKQNNCQCYYCETSIHDIKLLLEAGLLKPRKTGNGIRGPVLEVDKNDDNYTQDCCVLSCYYCNNDKSYTSEKNDYKAYFGANRKNYFKKLLLDLKIKNV